MKTLLSMLCGIIIGAIGTYHYYHTSGKIHITEVKTITETNWVQKIETRYFTETKWETRTNIVWLTNFVQAARSQQTVNTTQFQRVSPTVKPAAGQTTPTKIKASTFGEARKITGRTDAQRGKGTIGHTGVKRDLMGNVIEK